MGDIIDITAPMQGTIVTLDVTDGQQVRKGQQLMLIESMKMHHAIESTADGVVRGLLVAAGATVMDGAVVAAPVDCGDDLPMQTVSQKKKKQRASFLKTVPAKLYFPLNLVSFTFPSRSPIRW